MLRIIAMVCLLFSTLAFAQIENLIQFHGQNAETITIDKTVSVVESRPYEVPDTCSRQVPYQVNECNDVTRYRAQCEQIPSRRACQNVPEQVCNPVTRSREECSNGPSRRVCTDIPVRQVCTERPTRQECRPVSRTREECSTSPSRQVCTQNPPRRVCSTSPSRQVCTTGPSRQVCTPRPSREVCTERPSREVCRTKPDGTQTCASVGGGQSCQTVGGGESCQTVAGAQSCSTVPGTETCSNVDGGQSCRTEPGTRSCRNVSYTDQACTTVGGGQTCANVGGGQNCTDVAGPRTCRDVSYQDEECTTVSRERCQTIPAHQECQDIPYTENVCGNVTRYNSESYACTRTEHRDETVQKQLKGVVDVKFITNGLVEEFPLNVTIAPVSKDLKEFTIKPALKKEPKVLVTNQGAKIKVASVTETEILLEGAMSIEVLEPKMINLSFPTAFSEVTLIKDTQMLSMTIEGSISAKGSIDLELSHKPFIGKPQTIATLKAEYPSKLVVIKGNKMLVNLAGLVDGKLKKVSMKLKLSAPLSIKGELLNAQKPSTEQEYGKINVGLQ